MKYPLVLVALAALAAAPASAQFVPPGQSALPPGRLTVVGHGSASVPPDRVRVTVRLFAQSQPGTVAASLDDAGRTVANAMRAAGVRDAAYVLPVEGFLGPNAQPAVVGSVAKPTRETMERIARDAFKALPPTLPGLQNFQISAFYIVDDCSDADARAQRSAMADARARAARAASAAGVKLGAILSVDESNAFAPACLPATATLGQQQMGGDPYGPLEVTVSVNAVVSFALH